MKADYDRIAADWDAARQTLRPLDLALLDAFLAHIAPGSAVLDLGCGTGQPIARALLAHGCHVRGVDRSARLLALARERLPEATFEHNELETYTIDQPYAGVVLWDVLFHLPRAEHEPLLERIHAALEPGGALVLTSGGSADDVGPFVDSMFGVEFAYDAFPRDDFVARTTALGFTVLCRVMLNEPDGGRDKGRLGLLLAKSD